MRSKFKWIFTLLVALSMQFSFAQEKTVTGTITDGKLPLPGANVVIKGTAKGVSADMDGKFSIKSKAGDVLVVSFTGYDNKNITVGVANSYKVALSESATILNEVIVGAMGIKRTKDATVSAQKQISNKELTQAANPNAIQALAGKVSGAIVSTISNGVNSENKIVLRGSRTVTGDNQALIVIDNAISSTAVLSQLPPDIIESVNVIKGSQGAALYGAQGVNGAIIVTTKKGSKKDKFTFGITSAIDFENVNFVPKTQNSYGQGWATDPNFTGPNLPANSGFVPWENGSWGPSFDNPNMPSTVPVGLPQADGNFLFTEWKPIKDNIKQFFTTGIILQNGFSFNVGGPDSYAYLSVNRQNSDFVVDKDKLVRNSFIFNAGKRVGKFNISGNFSYITQRTSQTDSDLMDELVQTASNVPVSRFNNPAIENHWTIYAYSPRWIIENKRYSNRSNTFTGVLRLEQEINKNISISNTANLLMRSTDAQNYSNGWDNIHQGYNLGAYQYGGSSTVDWTDDLGGGTALASEYFANQSSTRNIYNDFIVNFNYDLNKDVNLKLNVGNNIQDNMFRVNSQGGVNLDVPGFYHINNVLSPANPSTLDNRLRRSRQVAFFANLDVALKDYLFLNATWRSFEQYSAVPKPYNYPSVGVSFIPTKAFESLKGNKVLNYAKINTSYSRVGNVTSVRPYDINEVATIPVGFPFGNLASYQFNSAPTDPNIKPEFVNTYEIGAQFGFFNNRITLEGSVYNQETVDLISFVTKDRATGTRTELGNIGNLQNRGFEIDLGLTPIKTNSFRWDINANYSQFKTKVTKLAEGNTSVNIYQPTTTVGIFAEVGEEFPLIKGTYFERDSNGNIIVDAAGSPLRSSTFKKLGKGVPDFIVGLTNSFEYKGLKFTAVADLRMGASAYSAAKNLLFFTGGDLDTAGFDRSQGYVVPGSVTATGAVNTVPVANAATYAGVLNYFTTGHRAVGETSIIDASVLKIRELSLSYALPKKALEKTGIESVRFGVNARNPFVFLADGKLIKPKNGSANNNYGDPESSATAANVDAFNQFRGINSNASGIMNIGQYPTTSTYGFTFNITF
jgi:TonB-linked SusC/RagA family outer membrane protein